MIYCLFLKLPLVTSRNFNLSSYIFISTKVAWRIDRKALPHIPEVPSFLFIEPQLFQSVLYIRMAHKEFP